MVVKGNSKKVERDSNGNEQLKWETAKELGLDDDLAAGGDELSVKEAGKIGGNMVKKLIEKGKSELAKETQE
jgi:hypothetical protein